MTTREIVQAEAVEDRIRALLRDARPEQIRRLMADIMKLDPMHQQTHQASERLQ